MLNIVLIAYNIKLVMKVLKNPKIQKPKTNNNNKKKKTTVQIWLYKSILKVRFYWSFICQTINLDWSFLFASVLALVTSSVLISAELLTWVELETAESPILKSM